MWGAAAGDFFRVGCGLPGEKHVLKAGFGALLEN